FDPVSSAPGARPTPAPAGPALILRAWGAAPGQALFVGDSENDREAARGAGMVFAGFGGLVEGDLTAPDFPTLARMLGLEEKPRPGKTPSERA
nr:HAD family hydrolase [Desulfovibrio sp.]